MALKQGAIAGYTTALHTYNPAYHVTEVEFNYGGYAERLSRYWHNRRYADNTLYTSINRYASLYKESESLYRHIRGLRNPIHRLVQMEASKVLGGVIDYESFDTGAIIIKGADDSLKAVIRQVFTWSNMATLKTLYVREGAMMGDVALKVIDDPQRQKVRLELLDPRKVRDVTFDAVGNVISIEIAYNRQDENGKWYEYSETIDKEWFRTFKDGESYSYDEVAEWRNPYGFVPVRWVQHIATDLGFGKTSFHATRQKIDNLNDLATLIHDNVRKMVNAKFAVTGARPPDAGNTSLLATTNDNRDQSPLLYVGESGSISPIVSPLNIEGALKAALDQQHEIEADLPQLALQRMRDTGSDLSGVAIENLYSDAIDIISELQSNYLHGLKAATQMAISIGAFRRYPQFTGYTLDAYHVGGIDFDIRPRILFQDNLSMRERIELTIQALNSPASELILRELGYDDADVQRALGRQSRAAMRAESRALRQTTNTPTTTEDGIT